MLIIVAGCKTSKPFNENEGKLEKRSIANNSNYQNSNVIFEINSYKFRFDLKEFKEELNKNNYKALSSLDTVKIVQKNDMLIINRQLELHPINSYEINDALNKLFQKGNFYATKNNEVVDSFEYLIWEPKQGEIFVEWIHKNHSIRKITLGFSD